MTPSRDDAPDWVIETRSPEETEALAEALGRRLEGGEILWLRGELGAGKTCFASGLARGLGVREPAISPTYVILRSYAGRDGLTFHHFDFYRLEGSEDAEAIGAGECEGPDSVVLIEWPERCPEVFEGRTLEIRLTETGAESRRIEVRRGALPFDAPDWP